MPQLRRGARADSEGLLVISKGLPTPADEARWVFSGAALQGRRPHRLSTARRQRVDLLEIFEASTRQTPCTLLNIPQGGILRVLSVTWYVPAGVRTVFHSRSTPAPIDPVLYGMETDMCGTEARIEFPLVSAAGCGCCSTDSSAASATVGGASGTVFGVDGLTCGHCAQSVEKAVSALKGVESAAVDLVPGGRSRLTVGGDVDGLAVREAVASTGYTLISN